MDLHDQQQEVFDDPTRFRVIAAGRRWGKTVLAAEYLVAATAECERAGRDLSKFNTYYIAPTYNQAHSIMYDLMLEVSEPYLKRAYPSSLTFLFTNGRKLELKGADRPDRLRGVGLSDVVMDEYASMRSEAWTYVVRAMLLDLAPYSRAMWIGTPAGRNHFYHLWKYATESGDPEWSGYQYRTIDSPFIPESEVEQSRREMTEHAFAQEFLADFGSSGDVPLDPDAVIAEEVTGYPGDTTFVGVALQSFDRELTDRWDTSKVDSCCIVVVRQEGSKYRVMHLERGRWSARETCTRMLIIDRRYRPDYMAIPADALRAIQPYLEQQEEQFGRVLPLQEVLDPRQDRATRYTWAIQPYLERQRLLFARGDWLPELRDQFGNFPEESAENDIVRALAYCCSELPPNYDDIHEIPWSPLDKVVGL